MATLLVTHTAFAADVKVMISSGFCGAYSELGPVFERASAAALSSREAAPATTKAGLMPLLDR